MGFFSKLFKISNIGRMTVSTQTKSRIQSDWNQIKILIDGGSPSQMRQALITADKALDNALRDVVAGETMGERLKSASNKFDKVTYDKIWRAHKMRNALVHESGYEPSYGMLKNAIEDLRKGLNKLGVNV